MFSSSKSQLEFVFQKLYVACILYISPRIQFVTHNCVVHNVADRAPAASHPVAQWH